MWNLNPQAWDVNMKARAFGDLGSQVTSAKPRQSTVTSSLWTISKKSIFNENKN
jgi:hypothetical protein